MKPVTFIMMMAMIMISSAVWAQSKTDSIKVFGNCGMCKKRIEKAVTVDGVQKADWNTATKIMTVTYDPDIITNDAIQKKVAAAGHDTEKYSADDKVYEKLPGCCLYERKNAGKKSDHSQHH